MILSVLIAAALLAQSAPTASSEMLGINVPDEFQIGHRQRNEMMEIIELVRPPETVYNWSELVTVVMYFDGAQTGLDAFYARWRVDLSGDCPGMTDQLTRGSVDGHPALRAVISCPKTPQTGKQENLTAFLVQGDANMMMAQIAFRHSITSPDTALIERVKGSLKVCEQEQLETCSARIATGFVAAP